jgi:hypothetical protein
VGRRFESCRGRHDTKINRLDGNVENQPENSSRDVRKSIDTEKPAPCIGEDLLNVWQDGALLVRSLLSTSVALHNERFYAYEAWRDAEQAWAERYVFETRQEAVDFSKRSGSSSTTIAKLMAASHRATEERLPHRSRK